MKRVVVPAALFLAVLERAKGQIEELMLALQEDTQVLIVDSDGVDDEDGEPEGEVVQ